MRYEIKEIVLKIFLNFSTTGSVSGRPTKTMLIRIRIQCSEKTVGKDGEGLVPVPVPYLLKTSDSATLPPSAMHIRSISSSGEKSFRSEGVYWAKPSAWLVRGRMVTWAQPNQTIYPSKNLDGRVEDLIERQIPGRDSVARILTLTLFCITQLLLVPVEAR